MPQPGILGTYRSSNLAAKTTLHSHSPPDDIELSVSCTADCFSSGGQIERIKNSIGNDGCTFLGQRFQDPGSLELQLLVGNLVVSMLSKSYSN